jgi:hypothetical protein
MTRSTIGDERPSRLTALTEQRRGWRPDWPLWVWLLPTTAMLAAAAVARVTVKTSEFSNKVSPTAGYLFVAGAVLVAVLSYAFSDSRWPWRPLVAFLAATGFEIIKDHGFSVTRIEHGDFPKAPPFVRPLIAGAAERA